MNQLTILTRYPQAGTTKTRLIPAVGAEQAAAIHREMTEHTLNTALALKRIMKLQIEIAFHGGNREVMTSWLRGAQLFTEQVAGDLGEKMNKVFETGFHTQLKKIVIIGTDCPELTVEILKEVFLALDDNDLVLGPAFDGGYYCIGLTRLYSQLFENISWGTDRVLEETLSVAGKLNLRTKTVQGLHDVDRPEDLPVWEAVKSRKKPLPIISVIIPTYNEEENIKKTIRSAKDGSNIEIIVVDGGSQDKTVKITALQEGVKVLHSRPNRSSQLNLGAQKARGKYLLFLHADTLLPVGYEQEIVRIMKQPGTVAGAFRLKIDLDSYTVRFFEAVVNFRSKIFKLPYGDQGIFIKKTTFQQIGGFPHLLIMDDFEFIRNLKRKGNIQLALSAVCTSGRRWQALGVWRTFLINQLMVIGYFLGVSQPKLQKWYRRAKKQRKDF